MSINIDDLLSDLEKSMSEVAVHQMKAQDRSIASRKDSKASTMSSLEESSTELRFPGSVRQRTSSQSTHPSAKSEASLFMPLPHQGQHMHHQQHFNAPHQIERSYSLSQMHSPLSPTLTHNEYTGSVVSRRSMEEDEVSMLREQLDRARMELEHQEYLNQLLLFQHQQQAAIINNNNNNPSIVAKSNVSITTSNTATPSTTSSNSQNPLTRHPTGWGGRSSKRFSNPISDIIIDEACLNGSSSFTEKENHVPVDIVFTAVNLIQESAQAPTNKGLGANQAIHAIMHVINAQDPVIVRRGMQVLDIVYRFAGPIFWLNLSLNLDFFQHFLETRQHIKVDEQENVEFLCGLFAGWYALDAADEKVLKSLNHMKDPSPRVKEFFEGLVRAGYTFPEGSLKMISADRIAAIKGWSLMRRTFTFTSVKR
ncbi:hypothetical protein HDU77_007102 [Chytriomyces hyalinus]|nr:hypothetical protein HDU77_007102 [Chytriomyces hyalinus]